MEKDFFHKINIIVIIDTFSINIIMIDGYIIIYFFNFSF